MTLKELDTTWIGQLSKKTNRKTLENFRDSGDRSPKQLACFYTFLVRALINTPAWGVNGVNKMMNETTTAVRATLNKAKKGKTSAPALARKLISTIDYCGDKIATNDSYRGRYKLEPILTPEEVEILAQMN